MAKKKTGRSARPAKRKSVDKADKVETRKVDAGTNELPWDDKRKNRFKQHMATLKGYDEKIATLTGHRRKACEVIKAEGYILKAITETIKLEKSDPLEHKELMRQRGIGMEIIGTPHQFQLYDIAYDSPEEQAKAEGIAQAKAGRAPENRWPEGSPEAEAYAVAYHKEQSARVPGADKLTDKEREAAVKAGRAAKTAKQAPDFEDA